MPPLYLSSFCLPQWQPSQVRPNLSYLDSTTRARNRLMSWLLGKRLQSSIRHLRWTLSWSVPACNLRDRRAKQTKRLRMSQKSYRCQAVWGATGFSSGPFLEGHDLVDLTGCRSSWL